MCVCVHLSRADGLTQLTGDAALLSIGVATEGVLSTEAGRQRSLLKRVVDSGRFTEQVTHGHPQTWREGFARKSNTAMAHVKDNAGFMLYFSYCQEIP